jgi:hypothetical protein
MGLFQPAWQSKNIDKALRAVGKLTDQSVLADIAKSDWHINREVRRLATSKLDDQSVLAYIMKNSSDFEICETAVRKLTNKSLLIEIAKNNYFEEIRKEAIRNINDESVISDIVLLSEGEINERINKRIPGGGGVTSGSVLAVSKYAIEMFIKDENILAKIVLNSDDEWVRVAALRKITDQSVLTDIAFKTKHIDIQNNLLNLIDDDMRLYDIFTTMKKTGHGDTIGVVNRIKSSQILREILSNEPSGALKFTAAARLQDQGILEKMIQDETSQVREMSTDAIGFQEREIVLILLPSLKNEVLQEEFAVEFATNTFDMVVLEGAVKFITDIVMRNRLMQRKNEIASYHSERERLRTAGGLFG